MAVIRFSPSLMIIERRSAPISTLSLANSKSSMRTTFWLKRAAFSAAPLPRGARHPPEGAGGAARQPRHVHVVGHRDLLGVHTKNPLAPLHVRAIDDDPA